MELSYDKQQQKLNFLNKSSGRPSSLFIGNKKLEELKPCIVLKDRGDMAMI